VDTIDNIAITLGPTTNGRVEIIIHTGAEADYYNALADARAFWVEMHRNGPAPTDEGKLAVIAELNTYMAEVKTTAAILGIPFHFGHIIGD
jgi:hypothetical protein